MAAHACLKSELTEDEQYHNLMAWLICIIPLTVSQSTKHPSVIITTQPA